jgi:hypothetical protein
MAVGELKNEVGRFSTQGQDQTKELREIRDQITGAKAIIKFIAWMVALVGVGTIVKLWPVIHGWLLSTR